MNKRVLKIYIEFSLEKKRKLKHYKMMLIPLKQVNTG